MNLSLLATLFLCSLSPLVASQITLYKACDSEIIPLKGHLVSFYSQELLKAGLFTDELSAFEAANKEISQQAPAIFLHLVYLTAEECKGTQVGYVAYSIDAEEAYIEGLYLDEGYRGQGLGQKALDSLENELREERINKVRLYVFAHNQTACNLYKKMNYVIEESYFYEQMPIGYSMKKEIAKKST